jgi:hypothetical protein
MGKKPRSQRRKKGGGVAALEGEDHQRHGSGDGDDRSTNGGGGGSGGDRVDALSESFTVADTASVYSRSNNNHFDDNDNGFFFGGGKIDGSFSLCFSFFPTFSFCFDASAFRMDPLAFWIGTFQIFVVRLLHPSPTPNRFCPFLLLLLQIRTAILTTTT